MSPDLRRLFDAVSDLPEGAQRAALLVLTQDKPLIDQVLRVCGHAQTNNTVISEAISSNANDLTAILSNELRPGDTLDTWKLIEKIGQGGMGSVFLAERADGHFQQTVAVKVMHGLPTPNATARLAQERQILASLTHPNIARLFDGGATPNGQPYLVLEYIAGLTIDAFCRTKKLDFQQILDLLLPICDAVAVAHQRLIIHCDIKPSNILVSQAGRPSLLDFGIASLAGEADLRGNIQLVADGEALGRHDGRQTEHFTQTTMRGSIAVAYTPRYASPEQKASKPISTATDIYSLGRVIEDLCDLDSAFKQGAVRGKAQLQMQEVRAIIDKACADIPAARYGSAQALAADIKNALRGARVEAAADAATAVPNYLSRKWFSQHWLHVAAACLLLAIITGFTLKVIAEKNQAQYQAAKAEAERLTANQARAAAEAAQKETQVAKNDALTQLNTAEGARNMAESARNMAEDARKQALSAEQAAVIAKAKAEKSEAQAVIERDNVTQAQKSTETVNNFLVSIFDGVNPGTGGSRNASARDVVARAEKKLDALKTVAPEAQAKLFRSLAHIHQSLGDKNHSAQYSLRAADAYKLAGNKFNAERVTALSLASIGFHGENNARALALAQQAVQLAADDKATAPLAHARALNALIVALHGQTRYQEARLLVDEVEQIYAANSTDPWSLNNYVSFRHNAAFNQYHLGNFRAAELAFKKQIDFRASKLPVEESALGNSAVAYANALKRQGKNTEAEAQFRHYLLRMENTIGEENFVYRDTLGSFALLLIDVGKYDEADAQLLKAEAITTKYRDSGGALAGVLSRRATLAEAKGQRAAALDLLQRAAKLHTDAQGEANNNTADLLIRIARLHLSAKALPEAREAAERALAMRKQLSGAGIEGILSGQRALADVERADNNPAKAIDLLTQNIAHDNEASLNTQYNNRMALSRAWAAAHVAEKNTDAPSKIANMKANAIQYAQAALVIAEKSGGITSANYKSANTMVASLSDDSKSSSPKLGEAGRAEAAVEADGLDTSPPKVEAAIAELRKLGADAIGKTSAKTLKTD